jgi:metal-responsive CopG/Arc/MetJ family transcriptional regulator
VAKVLLSIDDELLARIDRAARRAGLSRSAYLARLAARELGAARGAGADPRARRAAAALDALFRERGAPEEATAAVRADRDSR